MSNENQTIAFAPIEKEFLKKLSEILEDATLNKKRNLLLEQELHHFSRAILSRFAIAILA